VTKVHHAGRATGKKSGIKKSGIEPWRRPGVGSVRNAPERIGGPLQDVPHLLREGRPGLPVVVIGPRAQELHKLCDAHAGPSALAL